MESLYLPKYMVPKQLLLLFGNFLGFFSRSKLHAFFFCFGLTPFLMSKFLGFAGLSKVDAEKLGTTGNETVTYMDTSIQINNIIP